MLCRPRQNILVKVLNEFGDAFNRHDSEALVSMTSNDCEFRISAGGHQFGTSIRGKDAVKLAFDQTFSSFPDSKWVPRACNHVVGNRGFSEWTFVATRASDNLHFEVDGVDLFTFDIDGRISLKDAYRKDRPPFEL